MTETFIYEAKQAEKSTVDISVPNIKVSSHNFCRSSVEILHSGSDINSHPCITPVFHSRQLIKRLSNSSQRHRSRLGQYLPPLHLHIQTQPKRVSPSQFSIHQSPHHSTVIEAATHGTQSQTYAIISMGNSG